MAEILFKRGVVVLQSEIIKKMARKSSKTAEKDKQAKQAKVQEEQAAKDVKDSLEETAEEPQEKEETDSKKQKSKRKEKKSKEIELQEKVSELNDKYLRLYSEFDNYRKRTIKERIELSKTASEEVITELLPVMDDFERAIKSAEESNDCGAVKEGMQLIFNKVNTLLQKKGLTPIEAIGKEFDTDFHEAITYIPAPSKDLKDKIVDEIEKGYMLGEKVIRYTKVVIGQ